jgi:tRNA(Ile)-lysidine synthase
MLSADTFEQSLRAHFSTIHKDSCIYVAVSGGIDSIVLLHLFRHTPYIVRALHCNFKLRQAESDRDEGFVRNLCQKWGVSLEVHVSDAASWADSHRISIQEAARNIRYDWFESVLANHPGSFVATAHHANDSVESFLFHAARGTGIRGLAGIPRQQGNCIRPLFFAFRDDIRSYASTHKLTWVEDSSNESSYYTRNFIRHKVIPVLEEKIPAAVSGIYQSINHLREVADLYRQSIELYKKQLLVPVGNEWHIPIEKLLRTIPLETVLYELIRDFRFSHDQLIDIIALTKADNGSYVPSATHRVIKNRRWLIIAPAISMDASHIVLNKNEGTVNYAVGALTWQLDIAKGLKMNTDHHTAMLDSEHIQFPLLLRPWKQGDYFYPLGMKKKKKLSRFFIDLKLSVTEKERVWVLESNKSIIWVIGYRIDDRYRLTNNTSESLIVSFQPLQ